MTSRPRMTLEEFCNLYNLPQHVQDWLREEDCDLTDELSFFKYYTMRALQEAGGFAMSFDAAIKLKLALEQWHTTSIDDNPGRTAEF
jgi:hypothetical protein